MRAAALRGSGACMFFAACVPSCALQACLPIESVMSEVDIFVSSKRNFNILDHMEELKNNAFRRALTEDFFVFPVRGLQVRRSLETMGSVATR